MADRSAWPVSYDHDGQRTGEGSFGPVSIMVEEFPHFGMNSDEPFHKWHALRDAGEIKDVDFKDVPDPLEGMSEEAA
ncbi:hypothetical protein [Methylobacterium sp.]|uniref:hypothetical protein n=1 Tax=Methylobacterium sp. TaxID=409 RepID=UPI003B0280A1